MKRKVWAGIIILVLGIILVGIVAFGNREKMLQPGETMEITLDKDPYQMREYMGFQGSKVLYRERDSYSHQDLYLYDFQRGKSTKIGSIDGASTYYGMTGNGVAILIGGFAKK